MVIPMLKIVFHCENNCYLSIFYLCQEKLESLRGECDELARRARNSEDALQRDADAKVQVG